MGHTGTDDINRLIGEFMHLQELWERDSAHFDWTRLETLAQDGAQAYNEGAGPSFHALALDGVNHNAFHERFLELLLKSGFDPFHLARPGTGIAPIPVIDHAGLREAADVCPSSARMHALLMQEARDRFATAAAHGGVAPETAQVVAACAESMPSDLLERIAPELASPRQTGRRRSAVDPVEGYLSPAEIIVESGHVPYG